MAKATLAHRVDAAYYLDNRLKMGGGMPSNRAMPKLPDANVINEWLEGRLPGSVPDERLAELEAKVSGLKERGLITSTER